MIPLPASVLSLCDIAEHWSREIRNIRTTYEIFDELLSSFWNGTLDVTGATGEHKVDRHAILKILKRCREHPGFKLIENAESILVIEQAPSGNILVDTTNYIILPANESTWTHEVVEAAYVRLAKMSFADFDELIRPGFIALSTTREALRSYCKALGYPLPRFWFAAGRERGWNTRREREARIWFKQIATGRKRKAKSAYHVEALKQYPDMPAKAFDRIWATVAPPAWRKSGPVVRPASG